MLWNSTRDETRPAPDRSESGPWDEWLLPDVDGFGLPLVGSLLGIEPRPESEPATFAQFESPRNG
jgi:hypothetical protein